MGPVRSVVVHVERALLAEFLLQTAALPAPDGVALDLGTELLSKVHRDDAGGASGMITSACFFEGSMNCSCIGFTVERYWSMTPSSRGRGRSRLGGSGVKFDVGVGLDEQSEVHHGVYFLVVQR